ncbi:uncharacterized protein ACR2FA_012406 [Aphomia sociella]
MKLFVVLMLCAFAAAAPHVEQETALIPSLPTAVAANDTAQRNILVNILVRQLIQYLRYVINNGSAIFGIPPLDPFELDALHIVIPAGLINLDLDLKNAIATGFGGFVVHKSDLDLRDLTFDLDISIPRIDINCESYDLVGDLLTAIPLYGKGQARFEVENFRMQAKLYLKQSDDRQSVLIDRVENAAFQLPSFKSHLTGVIGGGDVDAIANAITEEVIIGYVNRFQGAISTLAATAVITIGNPLLDQLDTWKFIAPLIPS